MNSRIQWKDKITVLISGYFTAKIREWEIEMAVLALMMEKRKDRQNGWPLTKTAWVPQKQCLISQNEGATNGCHQAIELYRRLIASGWQCLAHVNTKCPNWIWNRLWPSPYLLKTQLRIKTIYYYQKAMTSKNWPWETRGLCTKREMLTRIDKPHWDSWKWLVCKPELSKCNVRRIKYTHIWTMKQQGLNRFKAS